MLDLAFYNAGCDGSGGLRRVLVFARRLLRRILRPVFLHQAALFQAIVDRLDRGETTVQGIQGDLEQHAKRQDELDERVETVLAFGWDYVALVRRLAVLEDQVAALTGHATPSTDDAERQPSILFPSFDSAPETRAKVC